MGGTNGVAGPYRVMGRDSLLEGDWAPLGQHAREQGTNTWLDTLGGSLQFYKVSATN